MPEDIELVFKQKNPNEPLRNLITPSFINVNDEMLHANIDTKNELKSFRNWYLIKNGVS